MEVIKKYKDIDTSKNDNYITNNLNNIICNDSLFELKKIPDNSIDCIFLIHHILWELKGTYIEWMEQYLMVVMINGINS